MPKRPAEDANVETAIQAAGIKDDDWMQKLLEVAKEQLILIVTKPDRQQKQYRQEKYQEGSN
jgi:hypothetical protein